MARTSLVTLAVIAATAALGGGTSAQTPSSIISIEGGRIAGTREDGVESWKGIPFAASPTGPLRWRAPQPAAPWTGVREAARYGADCMQKPLGGDAAPLGVTPAEDCLYLNIWKPVSAKARLPVLVWIYGGGFLNGGSSPPTYAGANLARQGMVFVSFNYRLGRFGTFAHPLLSQENGSGGLRGNFGHLDQIAALGWVRRNIAAFGGDPANVTIMGESAGGMSVHTLVTSPLAQGLFARAVVMSGGNAIALGQSDLAGVEQIGLAFAEGKGIARDDPDALGKLRALPAERIVDGVNMLSLFDPPPGPPTFSGPFVDGRIAVDAAAAYRSGSFAPVPMMIGATDADIGGIGGMMVAGARHVAKAVAAHGVPTWEYRFSYVASSLKEKGAGHATDIPFFLDTQAVKYGTATTARDNAMGRVISRYVANFIRTGEPNGAGLPRWPKRQGAGKQIMNFATDGTARVETDPWFAEIEAAPARGLP